METFFVKDTQVAYIAALKALELEQITLPAVAPTFFATIAKLCGVEFDLVETQLDYSSEADVVANFFESFTPKAKIVFQNWGALVGEAKIFIIKYQDVVKVVTADEEIAKRLELFFDGGVKRGRLWNLDVVDVGIKNRAKPKEVDEGLIEESNRIHNLLFQKFQNNLYFDMVKSGQKTLKTEFAILLKPSLYCPKEDIYQELLERGVDVRVRFKPLYKMSLFQREGFFSSDELYKANLTLPLKEEVADILMDVLAKYRKRGCRF